MTAGTGGHPHHQHPHYPGLPHQPSPPQHSNAMQQWLNHANAKWTNTDAVMVNTLRAEYPQLHLTVVPTWHLDLLAYAAAGNAVVAPIDKEKDRMTQRFFVMPSRRMVGNFGGLVDDVVFGKFLYEWRGKEYIYYRIQGHNGNADFSASDTQFILSATVAMSNDLLLEAGRWNASLHGEVWVFDGGFWQKSRELYDAVQKASWDDVILDEDQKKAMINDVFTFFNSRDSYERLRVPWKRGVIYHGPPGNGKTISIKAMMHMLYSRKEPIPTLYVRSLSSFSGPEYSIQQIFLRARREAPCYLVFEDLDSLVTDQVRSYFLNAVDGIERNDGILMVGSTNHLDRLDPGLAKRPSRFDRKYLFDNPNEEQRVAYMHYWQHKLRDNTDIKFPDKICPATAKITNDFSFAYMQEAMIAALLAIARHNSDGGGDDDDDDDDGKDAIAEDEDQDPTVRTCLECMRRHSAPADGSTCSRNARRPFKGLYDWVWNVRQLDSEDPDLDHYILWRELKKQIRTLREELGDAKGQRN